MRTQHTIRNRHSALSTNPLYSALTHHNNYPTQMTFLIFFSFFFLFSGSLLLGSGGGGDNAVRIWDVSSQAGATYSNQPSYAEYQTKGTSRPLALLKGHTGAVFGLASLSHSNNSATSARLVADLV